MFVVAEIELEVGERPAPPKPKPKPKVKPAEPAREGAPAGGGEGAAGDEPDGSAEKPPAEPQEPEATAAAPQGPLPKVKKTFLAHSPTCCILVCGSYARWQALDWEDR